MKAKRIFLCSTILLLSACSLTLPVQGSFNHGKEPFLGQTTGYLDGSGVLTINTQSGLTCHGQYTFDHTRVSGSGTFDCGDGRHGTFHFTSDGHSGLGFGSTSAGEPFKFVFGQNSVISTW